MKRCGRCSGQWCWGERTAAGFISQQVYGGAEQCFNDGKRTVLTYCTWSKWSRCVFIVNVKNCFENWTEAEAESPAARAEGRAGTVGGQATPTFAWCCLSTTVKSARLWPKVATVENPILISTDGHVLHVSLCCWSDLPQGSDFF